MPHATEGDNMDVTLPEDGDVTEYTGQADNLFSDNWEGGEKDDDAQDYEDISDDDLPEEEEATNNVEVDPEEERLIAQMMAGGMPGAVDTAAVAPKVKTEPAANGDHAVDPDVDMFGESIEDNDLFGESMISSPVDERHKAAFAEQSAAKRSGLALPSTQGLALPRTLTAQHHDPLSDSPPSLTHETFSPDDDEEEDELDGIDDPAMRAQMQLFKISRLRMQGEEVDWDPVKTQDENKFWQQFPTWEDDEIPRFCELLPPVPGRFRGKVPVRPPKVLQPSKLVLDIMPDQEKSFKSFATAGKAAQDIYKGRHVVTFDDDAKASDDSDMDIAMELDDDEEIGGITMRDLAVICEDWDVPDEPRADTQEPNNMSGHAQSTNKAISFNTPAIFDNFYSKLDDPEKAAARIAKQVKLDPRDPYLLLDETAPHKQRKRKANGQTVQDGTSNRELMRRYNISNDEAYDLLKENHQHKVRSTLGSMAIEHSLPAARLQFPFYKVALNGAERRAFHRERLNLHEPYGRAYKVTKPKYHKKKHVRGREAKDLFAKAEDLSLGDNSSILMLEYSEEQPATLSNFGMGNRIINYYRKRDADDQERPKREIGEAHVLLSQDKSPFANFGHVDPGETVPAIQNGMYRAPIFQHEARSSDFILAISHTHEAGNKFYLRNAENLHVVGQQLPVSEVPGEHSRRVTDAAKKRLRAISYRIYSKTVDPLRRGPPLTNKILMKHIPGSDVPQTRSKMREFMKYEKKAKNSEDDGYWVPMPGQAVPDAETIRGWIRPEDICLLDSTQVGVQHLHDLGISTAKNEEENEDDDLEEGAHIEKQLAPWQTTKNFIAATQGKAMLALHGEGDPTGRGEGFSFIRTSMKGGYVAEGESVEEKLSERKRKEQGGHKYNVATQQAKYDSSIRTIWNRQKASLSNDNDMSESEYDDDMVAPEDAAYHNGSAPTPRTAYGTPAPGFDDSASQFSKQSADRGDDILIIKRQVVDESGLLQDQEVRIDNPKIIKLYKRRKQEMKLSKLSHRDLKPTGDAVMDALAQQEIKKELARLERNADRRIAREKLKGRIAAVQAGNIDSVAAAAAAAAAASPRSNADDSDGDGEGDSKTSTPLKTGKGRTKDGTARKCANCGQVGHIKTNRKLCPMLNGTWKPEDAPGAQNSSFGAVPAQLTL